MSETKATVDLSSLVGGGDNPTPLSQAKLNANLTAVVPFTLEGLPAGLHYCDEPEIAGYVMCCGTGCVLCRVGKKVEDRVLLPVYLPLTQRVGVMLVSRKCTPKALMPQLVDHIKQAEAAGQRAILFICRNEDYTFTVDSRHLLPTDDDGASLVKQVLEAITAGTVRIDSVVQTLTSAQLLAVDSIKRALALREG